jgi:glycosyltransferase involved in cell wall biosynthesis
MPTNDARREFKVLFVSHNHAAVRPGGLELYVQDLYEAARDTGNFDPVLLARTGPPFSPVTSTDTGKAFALLGSDPGQYLFYTHISKDLSNYDALFGRTANKDDLTREYAEFLTSHEPDVVHFHHTLFLGYDILRVTRNLLPDAPIVYSLHEYVPICHRDGQMIRTKNDELCQEESPRRCHECFPELTPQTFYMRKRFIQSQLELVDCFIVPSEYVATRYAEWGLDRSKIVVKPYSRQPIDVTADELEVADEIRLRNRFAYFGQLSPYKGADVLLEAIDLLGDDFEGELRIFGANLEIQNPEFRKRFEALLDVERENVRFMGSYERADIPKLMAQIDWVVVPSIWWETGPIVVWEAFQNGRPVIASDIGGMSEKVTDGVTGLHFRTGDPHALANVLARAVETPGLWDQLHANVPREPAHSIEEDLDFMTLLYRGLLTEREAPSPPLEAAQSA